MTKRLTFITFWISTCLCLQAQITIEQCVSLATENYPLIKKYRLLDQSREINISNINKNWLPQINVYGQSTIQNAVPSFPDILSNITSHTGIDINGLNKLQYKTGIDLNQTVWDGGTSKSQRNIERARNNERQSSIDVQLYSIRERVEDIFFSILLAEEEIRQTQTVINLLQSNLNTVKTMKNNGIAMQSDVDMIEAQYLTTTQQLIRAESRLKNCKNILSMFIGKNIADENLIIPETSKPTEFSSNRPELAMYDARIRTNEAMSSDIKSASLPRIYFFTQAYYGYPGLDYFKSMMNSKLSFNILAGIKVSWNIGTLYTRKNDLRKLNISSQETETDRNVFLFNTKLQSLSQNNSINELENEMKEDVRIVKLRENIRKAAESQLKNGVIDAHALLGKITDENQARLTAAYHKIKLIQNIYQLKYTLNR